VPTIIGKGKHRNKVRWRLFWEQRGLCHWCRKPMLFNPTEKNHIRMATFEHLLPRSHGGRNHTDNVVLACWLCNRIRGNAPVAQWIEQLPSKQSVAGSIPAGRAKCTAAVLEYDDIAEANRRKA
jgi:5-methylcytosine-specific restriction endonuclease McrA